LKFDLGNFKKLNFLTPGFNGSSAPSMVTVGTLFSAFVQGPPYAASQVFKSNYECNNLATKLLTLFSD